MAVDPPESQGPNLALPIVLCAPNSLGSGGQRCSHPVAIPTGIATGCEDRILDGPVSGEKGSKGRSLLDCIRGKGETTCSTASDLIWEQVYFF